MNKFRRESHGGGSGDRSRPTFKHPPHLKGRAIGLWYARQNKEKRGERSPSMKQRKLKIGKVFMLPDKKLKILQLLSECNEDENNFTHYKQFKDSKFKTDFLDSIKGNLDDKLEGDLKCKLRQSVALDEIYFNDLMQKRESNRYKEMLQKRMSLPSYKKMNEIIQMIDENQVVLISGDTGCGKTTQVAQFILDDHILKRKGSICRVICTQPRRISAISVAERVAQERGEKIGESTGYHIRMEKIFPRGMASITFCTAGILLKQMESDPAILDVSHLILDEIHERDITCDFLLAILKKVIAKRKDLKVILMSATLQAEKFSQYFHDCPTLRIPGFLYPVKEYYLEDVLEVTYFKYPVFKNWHNIKEYTDYIEPFVRSLEINNAYSLRVCNQLRNAASEEINLELIHNLILYICYTKKDNGAILVFLTGFAEISQLLKMLKSTGKFPAHKYIIIPLHSQLPTVEQKQIFNKPPNGVRKIVISTNIAETSITIDDIVYVIDCGKIKSTDYNLQTDSDTLAADWVAISNAEQRRGRAGRVQAGYCYHLYSSCRKQLLDRFQKPEILRSRLENVILSLKLLQLGNAEHFLSTMLDAPGKEVIGVSLSLLKRLNAIDDDENLTPLGFHLAKLPLSPQIGKMILLGALFSCLDPILSIAACLEFKDPFYMPMEKANEANQAKLKLARGEPSDHIVFYEALRRYELADNRHKFCKDHFMSQQIVKQLLRMKRQFAEYLHELQFLNSSDSKDEDANRNSKNMSLVKALICAGLYPNLAVVTKEFKHGGCILYTIAGDKVEFHPKTVLKAMKNLQNRMAVYFLRLKSKSDFLHDVTIIDNLPVIFFGDNIVRRGSELTVCNKLEFVVDDSIYDINIKLREHMDMFFCYKITHPGHVNWSDEDNKEIKVLSAIVELLTD